MLRCSESAAFRIDKPVVQIYKKIDNFSSALRCFESLRPDLCCNSLSKTVKICLLRPNTSQKQSGWPFQRSASHSAPVWVELFFGVLMYHPESIKATFPATFATCITSSWNRIMSLCLRWACSCLAAASLAVDLRNLAMVCLLPSSLICAPFYILPEQ